MTSYTIGSIVRVREREWVVQPSQMDDVIMLRPMGGTADETVGIYLPLEGDEITSASFAPPTTDCVGDLAACRLLLDSVRFGLRTGAGPFRCMGQLSVRPRPYQLVPLLMGLRLDTVRMLIADDVGVGKTIEGALIAREMLDRGKARRLCVLCLPHLCDQWKAELESKFNLPAVIVRPSTIPTLERGKPLGDISIFRHYPIQVVSIDYAKGHGRRAIFVHDAPDLVIVDEAHTAARPAGANASQQQRHELLLELVKDPGRHLIMLTAVPHSGKEESFLSLLGLLKPEFADLDLDRLSEPRRAELAKHFIQRRRADVAKWLGDTRFPQRVPVEASYELSPEYSKLFQDIYAFAREMVATGETMSGWKQRVRYWAALALLRCVMSSPAAAESALLRKASRMAVNEEEPDLEGLDRYIYDRDAEELATDVAPTQVIEEADQDLGDSDRARLRKFAKRAAELRGTPDRKLTKATDIVRGMLQEDANPIVFCRYIQTAKYVADYMDKALRKEFPGLTCMAVTGELSDDLREEKVKELGGSERRVLVATDCLSEGVNLQDGFSAVLHYDLPWNPNRLEQREGRVDRFGQRADKVKAVLYYGKDNPIDGAVLDVLLRKAIEIRKSTGIMVPLPIDSETIVESVLRSLFTRGATVNGQLRLDLDAPMTVAEMHRISELTAAREKESRSRFAQHAIRPDQVAQELDESDAVLGSQDDLQRFISNAVERLGSSLKPDKRGWRLDPQLLPKDLRRRLPFSGELRISFEMPAPEGYIHIARLHPLTVALTDYLLETALDGVTDVAARSGAIRTSAVSTKTVLMLLRVRYVVQSRDEREQLAEEAVVSGWVGSGMERLPKAQALELLASAVPAGNLDDRFRKQLVAEAIADLPSAQRLMQAVAAEGAGALQESFKRVSSITREGASTVEAQLPVDVLGVYVLLPVPGGVKA